MRGLRTNLREHCMLVVVGDADIGTLRGCLRRNYKPRADPVRVAAAFDPDDHVVGSDLLMS